MNMITFYRKRAAKWIACILALLLAAGTAAAEMSPATITDLPEEPVSETVDEPVSDPSPDPESETDEDPVPEPEENETPALEAEKNETPASETEEKEDPAQEQAAAWLSPEELAAQGYLQATVISAAGAPVFVSADEQAEVQTILAAGTLVWIRGAESGLSAIQAGTEADPVIGYVRAADFALYLAETPEEEPVIRTITVTSTLTGMEYVSVGTEIELKAELHGFLDTDSYLLQWQYSPDGGVTVLNADGGNELIYHYTIDEATFTYSWRLMLTLLPAEETAALNS